LVDDFFETKQEFIGNVVFDKGVFDNIKKHISRGETDINILIEAELRGVAQEFNLAEILSIERRLGIAIDIVNIIQ